MGLSSLDAALSGLRIANQQLSTISGNISNVGTPGYTRKTLPQVSQSVNGQTIGVLGRTIIREVNLNLERDLWTQVSSVSAYDVKGTYLSRIEKFHGPPDKELSIAAALGKLQDSFSALADSPSDSYLQTNTVNQAVDTAHKINDLAGLITQLRNDAQGEMSASVTRINDLLDQIANLNVQVKTGRIVNRTTADIEDKRDAAINELSGLIGIGFFERTDGVLVLQTTNGVELASDTVTRHLTFRPVQLSAVNAYPTTGSGVYVGDPLVDSSATDITQQEPGGKLGALIELRDTTFPKQMAQIDELAHKMALRFDEQGLRLFTDSTGNLPQDTAPDSGTATPVEYVGFARNIQVNDAIINNHSLLQSGTFGGTIPSGSNEVIRRVIQNTFGDVDYQQAIGNIDLRVSGYAAPNNTLQNFLGIHADNSVTGTRNLAAYPSPASFIAAANGALAPGSDAFRVTFEDPDLLIGPIDVNVALGAVPDTGGNFTQDLVSYITGTYIPGLPAPDQAALASMNVSFSVGSNGQLKISSNADITMDATAVAGPMGATGLAMLGFAEGTTEAVDPYFDIQVGNNDPVRISIGSADDENDLMAKLNAVPGLATEDLIVTSVDGHLRIRPGNSYANPDFGGDIKITAGTEKTSSAGANTVVGPGTIPDGLNIVSALFGSFTTGPLQDISPLDDVQYQSQVDGATPGTFAAFRSDLLGINADISTGISGVTRLVDYAQKMVNDQSQQSGIAQSRKADEQTLHDVLQKQLLDDSGVNLDEELSHLVIVQTAYAASARVITVVSGLFQELLNAVR